MGKIGRFHKDIEVEKSHFIRKISKYDIDRGTVDFYKLKREKEKEITENAKIKREIITKETDDKKQEEVKTKEIKIQ